MHVVWYTAMSMDGRIASRDHSLDFLDTIAGEDGGNDFPAFLAGIDSVLVGGSTMRWLIGGGHGWPHGDLPTWLVSHDEALVEAIGRTQAGLRRVEGDLAPVLEEIESAGHERVWLAGGGDVAGQVLALDRLDEVVVTVAPTAVGAGPALFDADALPARAFRLVECAPAGDWARLRWLRAR